jgi:serine/threonine-protein kinase
MTRTRASFSVVGAELTAAVLPRRLGPWLLERTLGAGAMSIIYQARSIEGSDQTGRYAIKLLDAPWQDDALAISLLRREAAIGRRVRHPHLVSVLAAHVVEAPYYLVMPLLGGCTAGSRLAAGELFSLPHALWIVRQAAEGLDGLHRLGYLHGDVKPGNVMVSSDGHTTLLDLGFVRELQETGSALDRPVVGTINYLAPEMLTSTVRADERSDLYSLGATLYELLAGRSPFRANSLEELVERQQCAEPPDVRALAPQVPAAVATLVRRLLARDPMRRPRTAREVVGQLIALEIATLPERIPA